MKLLRYWHDGAARPGLLSGDGQGVVPLASLADGRFPNIAQLFELDTDALAALTREVLDARPEVGLADVRLLAPVPRPGKYLAIGMNYRDHIAEAERLGVPPPTNQTWFNKQTTCIGGPFDDIDPGVTEKLDYEVELGFVIGRRARFVDKADAPDHVFGYLVANDVSARDWQFHAQTFTVGKSFDTHGPVGPWLVTRDEIPDPHSLGIRCLVNSQLRQQSNTGQLLFTVWDQIEYLSTAFTLEPGDLLITGTPAGVGVGMTPQTFLAEGDVVRCEIDQIGAIENRVVRRSGEEARTPRPY
ncbi:MAG: fumarylacetoacetate hydrolase family protein [Devosia sp.]|jgi:2-keto-4-pentenoate hydratase/2-oxohepta-3-ene-1,7-dioic acid hydratase in catechol pathway|nr:fumarylacetoacetate hydrolase family protein [Devosia sp.]